MNDRVLQNAVFVKSGNNLVQEIACLEDALEFLSEWPKDRRGPIHQTALRACQRASIATIHCPQQRRVQRFCESSQKSLRKCR
jgi:hypothetical protein